MEYVYAAMLLHAAKKQVTEENLTKVLKAPGIEVNDSRVKALVSALSEINIDEAIKKAAIAPVAAAPAAAPAAGPAAAKEEKKKEEKEEKKEVSEEEAIQGLGSLFG